MKLLKQKHLSEPFVTLHKLNFEVAPWWASERFRCFRVGTCEGLYGVTGHTYDIIAITNSQPGNGHFEDVLQFFEHSCKRDRRDLRFMEIMNEKFGRHLVEKRGFVRIGNHCIKKFT